MPDREKFSFWKLLDSHEITIPIIQRDYAQGRSEEIVIRQKFLKSIKLALTDSSKPMFMDFIYGEEKTEEKRITPLDGQQRLTTLWLLHWYLAYKTRNIDLNVLSEDERQQYFNKKLDLFPLNDEKRKVVSNLNRLKKFSYETRSNSKAFCNHLCEMVYEDTDNLVAYIKKQPWFFSNYSYDPTINSMLNMIGGLDELDGLQLVFNEPIDILELYWTKLTDNNSENVIGFYYFPLEDFQLTDDLYIKMNARGKILTDFENFKADLLTYKKRSSKNRLLDEGNSEEEAETQSLILQRDFASKLDNAWTDIFWKRRNTSKDIVNKDNIDDMYFSFINRFLLADIVAQSDDAQDKISKEFADKKFNTLFSKLYNKELEYYGFDLYKEKLDICNALTNLEKCLDSISKNITNLGKVQNCCYPRWEDLIISPSSETEDDWENLEEDISKDVKFEFIPRKIKNETGSYELSTLKIHTRIAFYAICLYFIQDSSFNETNFKEWMQFVWNIIENVKAHQSVEVMISQDKFLYKISHESHRIMSWLCELDENNLPQIFNLVSDQMKEEIEKAKQKKNKDFIQRINTAENYAFFHGAIRFLFHDEQNNLDWNNFDKRFENAKRYFNNDGAKVDKYDLLKKYISFFDDWDSHFESDFIFDSEKKTWRDNLLNINRRKPTELLLMGCNKRFESSFEDPYQRYVHNYLLNTDAVITLGENIPGSTIKYKWYWGNSYVIHPYNCKAEWRIYYIHYRNELLTNIKGISFRDVNQEKWRKNGLCWNKNIEFIYKGHNFLWDEQNMIYLLKDDLSKTKKTPIEPDEPWAGAEHPKKFMDKLQELIDK